MREPAPMPIAILTAASNLAKAADVDVTLVHDDLFFVRHNHFLLQALPGGILGYYLNAENSEEETAETRAKIVKAAAELDLLLMDKGRYTLSQDDPANMRLEFLAD